MQGSIFFRQADGRLVRMMEQGYEAEATLQRLLESHPDLLGGEQIDPDEPRRWLLIGREEGIPGEAEGGDLWSVDHLFLDQSAIPTFVEVKRSTDTRTRREVVAQMLDYAANAQRYWPVDRLREDHAQRCRNAGLDPESDVAALLGTADTDGFWEQARRNLAEGRVRLLFVADAIPPSLRTIIEFLNRQMSTVEVLGIEIKQFVGQQADTRLQALVPRVIGQSEQARQTKTNRPSRPSGITEEEFFQNAPAQMREAAKHLLRQARVAGMDAVFRHHRDDIYSIVLLVPGVSGTPVNLSYDLLWISLGRYHPVLKDPSVNQELRQLILSIDRNLASARNPEKSEVGIPLARLASTEAWETVGRILQMIARTLTSS
jgi:hypothetical protein